MALFLSIIASMVPYLPVLLSVAGWMLSFFGASKENLAKYQEMIQKNKDSGLISVDTYTKLSNFHSQMETEAQKKLDDAAKPKP